MIKYIKCLLMLFRIYAYNFFTAESIFDKFKNKSNSRFVIVIDLQHDFINIALKNAKEICIYKYNLDKDFFSRPTDGRYGWIYTNANVKILSSKIDDDVYNILKYRPNIEIRRAKGNYGKRLNAIEFVTMDNNAFIFQIYKGARTFIGSFNEENTTLNLKQIFDKAFEIGENYEETI